MLTLSGVSYRYPGASHETLHAISLELADGTITGLAGPADAGKSTLCLVAGGLAPRIIGGSLVGDVSIDGVNISGWPIHRLSEAVVTGLQDPVGQLSLIADTVFDEVAFGPANLGLPRAEVLERTDEALQLVDITDLADHDPRRLSGGQQQLVVIAALLSTRPRHLVLDEPVAHLDARGTSLVLEAVTRIAATGTAVFLAETRTEALVRVCDSLTVIARGNVIRHGPVMEVLDDPAVGALRISTTVQRMRRRLVDAGLTAEQVSDLLVQRPLGGPAEPRTGPSADVPADLEHAP